MLGSVRIYRTLRTLVRLKSNDSRKKSNPGVGHSVVAFDDAISEMQQNPEGFGDLESDFVDVHKAHTRYEVEQRKQDTKIRQMVVKSKYFQESKLPNFLTLAEKEQIRFLHSQDAEQWSVEVLAESFPANCEIIRKVLKASWKPLSAKRINSHDLSVARNWDLLRKGEFDIKLPEELKNHLFKFNVRHLKQPQVDAENVCPKTELKSNTFSSLIATCTKRENAPIPQKYIEECSRHKITYTEDKYKVFYKKHVQIKPELKNVHSSAGENTKFVDYLMNVDNKYSSGTTGIVEDLSSKFTQKFTLNEVEICDEDKKRFEITTVKDRIHIPRNQLREGAIYRVEDSYYDDDGEFLYRVPGMKGK